MNTQIFREYDIRGIVGKDLTKSVVLDIGKAFGSYIQYYNGKNIVVGRDNRLSSPLFMEVLIDGLLSTGCNVYEIGEIPSPVLYFAVMKLKMDGGIIVTASHNPVEYNGFKMRKGNKSIFGKDIQHIKKIIEDKSFKSGKGERKVVNIIDDYITDIKQKIKLKRQLTIVVDSGNGTTGPIVTRLFKELGCNIIGLFCKPDGNFPNHLPDPTIPEFLTELSIKVKETKADLGIAYDGDGDRIGALDENGEIIWADQMLILFAREILKKGPASIVFDVKCSQALIDEIKNRNGIPVIWKTGYPLMQDKMRETEAPVGGEMSGHMYFNDNYYGFDDAIFASCRLIELLSKDNKKISQLLADIPRYYSTPEVRIDCTDEDKFRIIDELKIYFTNNNYDIIDIDGIRVNFGDGWGLVRASNTQPVLVLRFEAKTKERLQEIIEIFKEKLRQHPAVKFKDDEF